VVRKHWAEKRALEFRIALAAYARRRLSFGHSSLASKSIDRLTARLDLLLNNENTAGADIAGRSARCLRGMSLQLKLLR